ncbi:hypothetical protein EYF80_041871 [Liparis tanakae]|uniref:Uncharacterized protein n=1 Tax=Liparis tanakae TaxID=230148 RepID=A0A4Z2G328_9TELE|nr:hypothetical protein EYF80_041871 [Liparis tanakae]
MFRSYREELGEVELREEAAFGLLQDVGRQVAQLRLQVPPGGFSSGRLQEAAQRAGVTHQVRQRQPSRGHGHLAETFNTLGSHDAYHVFTAPGRSPSLRTLSISSWKPEKLRFPPEDRTAWTSTKTRDSLGRVATVLTNRMKIFTEGTKGTTQMKTLNPKYPLSSPADSRPSLTSCTYMELSKLPTWPSVSPGVGLWKHGLLMLQTMPWIQGKVPADGKALLGK